MQDLAMKDLLELVDLKLNDPDKYQSYLDNVGTVMKDFLHVAMEAAADLQKEIMEKQKAAMQEAAAHDPETEMKEPVSEDVAKDDSDEEDVAEAEAEAKAEPEAEAEAEPEAEPEAEAEEEKDGVQA